MSTAHTYLLATGQLDEHMDLQELLAALLTKLDMVSVSKETYDTMRGEAQALIEQLQRRLGEMAASL